MGLTALVSSFLTVSTLTSAVAIPQAANLESDVPPPTILRPIVHPDTDKSDFENFKPRERVNLFYASDHDESTTEAVGAFLDLRLNKSTVALEHNNDVKSVSCSGNNMKISLASKDALDYVAQHWPHDHHAFVLATYSPGCAGYDLGARGFSLVDSYTLDPPTLTVHAVVQDTSVQDITTDFLLNFGKPAPTDKHPLSKRLSKSFGKSVDFSCGPPAASLKTVQPFGSVYPIFESTPASLYCVGCGVNGSIALSGTIGWSIWHPTTLSDGNIGVNGALHVGAGFGVHVDTGLDISKSKQIFSQGLPGLSIPLIISIGPQVSASVNVGLEIRAAGDLLAGIALDWPDYRAGVDLESGTSQSTGFTPIYTHTFKAKGTFSATLKPSLPVSLGVGISIFGGKVNKQVAIVEQPGLEASAYVARADGFSKRDEGEEWMVLSEGDEVDMAHKGATMERDLGFDGLKAEEVEELAVRGTCNPGIDLNLAFINDVYLDIFGSRKKISSYNAPIASKCIPL